jgi:hypothetical protein
MGAVVASLWLPLEGLARLQLRGEGPDVATLVIEGFEADVLGNVSDQVAVGEDLFRCRTRSARSSSGPKRSSSAVLPSILWRMSRMAAPRAQEFELAPGTLNCCACV